MSEIKIISISGSTKIETTSSEFFINNTDFSQIIIKKEDNEKIVIIVETKQ